MGDGLAEKLYIAWRAALPDPTSVPSWGNMPSEERLAWEAAATAARQDAAAKRNDEIEMLRDANVAWQREHAELMAKLNARQGVGA